MKDAAIYSDPVRFVKIVGCLLVGATAGCSSGSPVSTPTSASAASPTGSAVKRPSIPGIGATRADWEASHTPNKADKNGSAYGYDPSLPSSLSPSGAVYVEVSDLGTGRVQVYALNLPTIDRDKALARVRQELPSDATVAWDLTLAKCYRVTFNSATLAATGPYMAEVELEYIQSDGTSASSPNRFNQATFTLYTAGTPPNPETAC